MIDLDLIFVISKHRIYLCSFNENGDFEIYQKDGSDGYEISDDIDDTFGEWIETKTGIMSGNEARVCCIVAKECTALRKQLFKKFQERDWRVVCQDNECWKIKDLRFVLNQVLDRDIDERSIICKHGELILSGWSISGLGGEEIKSDILQKVKVDVRKEKKGKIEGNSDIVPKDGQSSDNKKNSKLKVYTQGTKTVERIVTPNMKGGNESKKTVGNISEQKQDVTGAIMNEYLREKHKNDVVTVRNG